MQFFLDVLFLLPGKCQSKCLLRITNEDIRTTAAEIALSLLLTLNMYLPIIGKKSKIENKLFYRVKLKIKRFIFGSINYRKHLNLSLKLTV